MYNCLTVYFKRLTDVRGSTQQRVCHANSSSERPRTGGILIRSEFCIKLVFSRHTRKYVGKKCTRMYTFKTDMDVRGSTQQRVCHANSSLSSCTRMYNCSTRLIDKAETVGNGASPFCALIFIFPLDNSYNGKFFHRYH